MITTENNAIQCPFRRITDQNHRLMDEMKRPDFDGFVRLDPTLNQAVTFIHQANEIIARYPQGSFPLHRAYAMVYSTLHLLRACERRYGRARVKAMAQAFRSLIRLWFYEGAPRCPPKNYLKILFNGERKLVDAICEHNRGIVESPRAPAAEAPRTTRTRRSPRKGTGLHGTRTKCMLKQIEEFKEFLLTHPVSDLGQGRTLGARARQFWAANAKRFQRAALATGEKRGYRDANKLASACRASRF